VFFDDVRRDLFSVPTGADSGDDEEHDGDEPEPA